MRTCEQWALSSRCTGCCASRFLARSLPLGYPGWRGWMAGADSASASIAAITLGGLNFLRGSSWTTFPRMPGQRCRSDMHSIRAAHGRQCTSFSWMRACSSWRAGRRASTTTRWSCRKSPRCSRSPCSMASSSCRHCIPRYNLVTLRTGDMQVAWRSRTRASPSPTYWSLMAAASPCTWRSPRRNSARSASRKRITALTSRGLCKRRRRPEHSSLG
mmetsp:Transcript_74791/g.148647  ORF Transcript_74791/g.148647 Transcript_74791/m.148647 type:complete len:216 (-) Transcript_74791:408-1055(-)